MCPPMFLMLWNFAEINTVSLVLLIEAVSYDFYRFLTPRCSAKLVSPCFTCAGMPCKTSSVAHQRHQLLTAGQVLNWIGSHKPRRWGLASTSIHHAWAWATAPQPACSAVGFLWIPGPIATGEIFWMQYCSQVDG